MSHYVALGVCLLEIGYAALAGHGPWTVVILGAISLGLIWFAGELEGAPFGHWYRGQRIDAHTPPGMIAGMGWLGRAACALWAVDPGWMDDLVGLS